MMRLEKLNSIERALIAAATMSPPDARNVLRFICEAGMTTVAKVDQPTEGQKHYAKREKFINRMKSAQDRILNYAKHETLRKVEKHFRLNPPVKGGDEPVDPSDSLATRLTFDRPTFTEELLAALRDESALALGTAGQQLYDEIGKDDPFKIPDKQAVKFLDTRANLLSGASDDLHKEVMQTIQDGLENGETRGQLMTRIGRAFEEIKKSRAETIANTETAAAFNFSREKAMKKAGVTHKKWLHSMSPLIKEPRQTHLEADGQVQPIDEPFDIGGVKMQRPGDESAGPEEIINCHCVAIPVEAPIESADQTGHPFRGNQYVSGYHTSIKPGFSIGFPGQRGEGTYISLDSPWQPNAGKVLRATTTIQPNEVLDPRNLLPGSNVKESRLHWGAGMDKVNAMSDSEVKKLGGARAALTKYYQEKGYKAEIGLIEPGNPKSGRELVVWDRQHVKLEPMK